MASDGGGGGEELLSATAIHKKLKIPRKIFGDSNTVDPASVPRKLRSAIRKRSGESTLSPMPDGKRSNNLVNGVEPLRKDCLKKSKISMQRGCLDHSLKLVPSVPISKDEEEVAETLFALAGLIPLSDLQTKNKMDDESSDAKASDMEEKHENSMPVSRVPKEDQEVTTTSMTNSEENALIGPKLSERRPMNLNLKVSVPPVSLQKIPHLLRTCDQRPSISSTFFHTSTEPSTESGLNEIKQKKAFIPNSKSLIRTEAVEVENQHSTLVDRRHNGVSVTSRVLHDSGIYGLHLQSSATIYPSWLNTTTSSSNLGTGEDTLSTDKLSCSMSGRNSWKRCAAHVYISRLIKVLQISEEKETQPLDTSQLRPSQSLGDTLITSDYSNNARGKMDGILTHTNMFNSADCKNSHESANIMPVNERHHQDQQEGPSFSRCCGSRNQSFDFLSLSSLVTPAADNGVNGSRNNLEPGAKGYVVYQHSVAQHGGTIPFSLQQNHLPSNPFRDQGSAVSVGPPPTPLQIPQYFSNPFAPAHMVSMMTSAQQPQPKQQQQQIWTAQLAAQFRPGPQLASHITKWQNGRKDLRSSRHMEALNLSSQPCPEELRAKYPHISQQQPQLIAFTRGRHQHSQLPSVREDNGNQLRPDGVLPLQLTLQ